MSESEEENSDGTVSVERWIELLNNADPYDSYLNRKNEKKDNEEE